MPRYGFKCTHCETEFEVSRGYDQAGEPAFCPLDGSAAQRIFYAPVIPSRTEDTERPAGEPEKTPAANKWSHHGHSHGPGAGGHSH